MHSSHIFQYRISSHPKPAQCRNYSYTQQGQPTPPLPCPLPTRYEHRCTLPPPPQPQVRPLQQRPHEACPPPTPPRPLRQNRSGNYASLVIIRRNTGLFGLATFLRNHGINFSISIGRGITLIGEEAGCRCLRALVDRSRTWATEVEEASRSLAVQLHDRRGEVLAVMESVKVFVRVGNLGKQAGRERKREPKLGAVRGEGGERTQRHSL